jgi:hypothetical protein
MSTESPVQHVPYAPPSAVVGVIRHLRNRGLTEPVTSSSLQAVGVSPGNAARTLQTLRFLGLVDDEGHITDTFKRLKTAGTDEYPATLAEVLNSTYHSVFNVVDPAEDEMTRIEDAFRLFEPSRQRGRMVTLFLGMCHEAGLVGDDKAPKVQSQPRQQRSSQNSTSQQGQRPKSRAKPEHKAPPPEEPPPPRFEDESHPYPLVAAIVKQLPKNGRWTEKRRTLWMKAMESAVNLAVEVEEPEPVYEGEVMPDQQELD